MRSIESSPKNENEPIGEARRMMDACNEDDKEEGGSRPSVRIAFVGIRIATGFAIS